jgi:hypothetical protein
MTDYCKLLHSIQYTNNIIVYVIIANFLYAFILLLYCIIIQIINVLKILLILLIMKEGKEVC